MTDTKLYYLYLRDGGGPMCSCGKVVVFDEESLKAFCNHEQADGRTMLETIRGVPKEMKHGFDPDRHERYIANKTKGG
jgi:hypothetical protein